VSRIKVDDIQGTSGTDSALNLSGKNLTAKGTFTVEGVHTLGTNAVATSEGNAVTTNVVQGLVKAWLHFNGTGTISITDSLNHASLTDHGTGDYSVTFSNNMNNADHATTGSTIKGGGAPGSSNVGLVTIGEGNSTSLIGIGSVANTANANDRSKIYSQVTGDLA